MKDESILNATGSTRSEWYTRIREAGMAEASHKQIAEYLAGFPEVSFWWAQTLTVEYEKHIGRRVKGQTSDGMFQVGVSRTFPVTLSELWEFLDSPEGLALLLGSNDAHPSGERFTDGLEHLQAKTTDSGIDAETTTFNHGSHLRMRFAAAGWEQHSILQIRLEEKGEGKTSITFHHEKLPGAEAREQMRSRWRGIAGAIADRIVP